jgi:hypothetical protein
MEKQKKTFSDLLISTLFNLAKKSIKSIGPFQIHIMQKSMVLVNKLMHNIIEI